MVTFDEAWARTGALEGGYVKNPDDPGGETNHGITLRVARQRGYTAPMKNLPLELAVDIGKREYWDPLLLDQVAAISGPVALELFDTNFNFWYGAAGSFLQRSLNALGADPPLKPDGQIGAGTVAALQAYFKRRGPMDAELVLLRALNGLQLADYVRQCEANPAKKTFFYGWVVNRVVI